ELVIDRLGDAEAARSVLAVDDDQIELPVALGGGQMLGDGVAARAPHDIAHEENTQTNRSENRLSHVPLAQDRGVRRARSPELLQPLALQRQSRLRSPP